VGARESSGKPRAARENLKIADIGPRAPRVVWLRRVYSPSEVWQVNLWLALRKLGLGEQMLGSPLFRGGVLNRSDGVLGQRDMTILAPQYPQ
jgi:hypothetical protein